MNVVCSNQTIRISHILKEKQRKFLSKSPDVKVKYDYPTTTHVYYQKENIKNFNQTIVIPEQGVVDGKQD